MKWIVERKNGEEEEVIADRYETSDRWLLFKIDHGSFMYTTVIGYSSDAVESFRPEDD